jgi:hypothetical protein
MLLETSRPQHFFYEIIATPDPEPVRAPRFIRWPSVCDTTRTNWVNPSAEPQPPAPDPRAETFSIDVGCHMHMPQLAPAEPLPEYLQTIETVCTPVASARQQAAYAAHTYSHDAVLPPLAPELRDQLYSTIDCGPGIPLPERPKPPRKPKRRKKKIGRPTAFDEAARARFCGMIETGCTIRYAAKRIGINRRTVRYACRTDPAFAERLRRAEQDRDLAAVGRIQNAGEKSWRAAAWLLERNVPEEYCLRRGKPNRSSPKTLGKRQFKQLVAEVARELPQGQQAPAKTGTELPQPKPRRPTADVIEAKIVELLGTLPPDERFHIMYRLGY